VPHTPPRPVFRVTMSGESRLHGTLERIEWREADTERGVVRERDARGALSLEERDEVGRAWPDERVDAHVPLGIERGQVRAQPRAARLDRERLDRHRHAACLAGRAPGDVDLNRLEHLAAAECRPRRAAPEQRLVDVVMEDQPEALDVEAAEGVAQPLGQRVADRVRMPNPFALGDLERRGGGRRRLEQGELGSHNRQLFRLCVRPPSRRGLTALNGA
jgi:hypothetical protein